MSSPASGSKPKMNLRSTAVKRIMQEASELATTDANDDFVAAPLETDIFEWHVTMKGTEGSEYEGGLYHLRILLPTTYPMSAPDIIFMTPNGRFELGKKICIDGLTSFHAGSWQPAWGVRTAVLGLRSFWMQGGEALSAIGALDQSKEERRRLAKLSKDWECPQCGKMKDQIPESASAPVENDTSRADAEDNEAQVSSAALELKVSPLEAGITSRVSAATPPRPPTPPTDIMPEEVRPPPTPTPTVPMPQQVRQQVRPDPPRQAPMWIDALIVAGICILVTMLYRKIGNSSNLIETVSL